MNINLSFFKKRLLVIMLLLYGTVVYAQKKTEGHKQLYQSAYREINGMLLGQQPMNFKKAVFLMENAYLNGTWDYQKFDAKIQTIAIKLKQLVQARKLARYKTAGNWATFTFMRDSISENNFSVYAYDFENFLPDKDPTVGLVTKLITTKKGNCVSLPFLYKILAEEIGASAFLAIAPIHCYIKHKDENGKWVNLEMTSGSFARDEWIMQQSGITVEQIQAGICMKALSQKEALAFVLKDLANNYQFQFGADGFDLKILETALKYYPNGVNLLMVKFEHYRRKLLLARQQKNALFEKKL